MKRSAQFYIFTLTLGCVALTLAPPSGAETQLVAIEGRTTRPRKRAGGAEGG